MKTVLSLLLGAGLVFALALTAGAADKGDKEKSKTVTLKGEVCCAKCCLKKQDTCHTVIKVKKGDKDVVFYFDPDSSKKYHKEICTEVKKGTVEGTTSEKDGKQWVKVSKVKFD